MKTTCALLLSTVFDPVPVQRLVFLLQKGAHNKTLIVNGEMFVRERERVSRIPSRDAKQKLKNRKSKKRASARRSAIFKSASWYAAAAMSIGVSAKA
jgi:hypothetical protein